MKFTHALTKADLEAFEMGVDLEFESDKRLIWYFRVELLALLRGDEYSFSRLDRRRLARKGLIKIARGKQLTKYVVTTKTLLILETLNEVERSEA